MTSNKTDKSLQAADLIYGYFAGTLSPAESEILDDMLAADPFLRRLFDSFNVNAEVRADLELMNSFDPEETIGDFHRQYYEKPKPVKLWRRIAIAAAIATMIFGAGLFFYNNQPKKDTQTATIVNDIAPGKQGATLTLAGGKKIRLSDAVDGELANEAGVVITKTANGQLVYEIKSTATKPNKINTLSTAKGETYQLRLPDGSLVWLNAASSLTYAANLNERGKRRVRLDGEGYFEIAKDKAHPFVVESRGQEVEVLGTHFNVNAYQDEAAVITTLIEGAVKVRAEKLERVLKPGEQSLNNGDAIEIGKANIDNITDWKDGDFNLERIDFRVAMRKIARWYDVEVVFDDSVPRDLETGGWISRDKNLSGILKFIEKSGLVHFKVEGRKVYVSR